MIGATDLSSIISTSKTENLEQLPKLTKKERHEIRLKLAELKGDDWIDNNDPLTVDEKVLLDARLAAYAKDLTLVAHGTKSRTESDPPYSPTELVRRIWA